MSALSLLVMYGKIILLKNKNKIVQHCNFTCLKCQPNSLTSGILSAERSTVSYCCIVHQLYLDTPSLWQNKSRTIILSVSLLMMMPMLVLMLLMLSLMLLLMVLLMLTMLLTLMLMLILMLMLMLVVMPSSDAVCRWSCPFLYCWIQ